MCTVRTFDTARNNSGNVTKDLSIAKIDPQGREIRLSKTGARIEIQNMFFNTNKIHIGGGGSEYACACVCVVESVFVYPPFLDN